MYGPLPEGTYRGKHPGFRLLNPGGRYRVIREFWDYDGDPHPAGEEWFFLGSGFLPYEEGLSLFVSLDGREEWHVRLRWTDEEQGGVIDHLEEYLRAL